MINKKNLLGKVPVELGVKDAIHTAIVSVRAGKAVQPGERCTMTAEREAVPSEKGVGVADPFRRGSIARGQSFWLLLDQDEVPNVAHVWEHAVDFSAPAGEAEKNKYISKYAADLGVTYEQFMEACAAVVEKEVSFAYPGTKFTTDSEIEEALSEIGNDHWYEWKKETGHEFYNNGTEWLSEIGNDHWYEWKKETGHEFYNNGTECCPEYEYPSCDLFKIG